MTTIVANLERMAADHRATDDGPPMCHVYKIRRIKDSLFGLAGDAMAGLAMLEWLEGKRSKPALYKMFGEDVAWRYEHVLLELSPEGLALWNAWGVRMPIRDEIYGIGTGSSVAVEALKTGYSAKDSIRRAIQQDPFSGLHGDDEPDEFILLHPEADPY